MDRGDRTADATSTTAAAQGQLTLKEWLEKGPYTLALSSGFFGCYAHCGAIQALEEAGCLPSRIIGTSSGALVAAAWAAGLDARSEMKKASGCHPHRELPDPIMRVRSLQHSDCAEPCAYF